MFRRRNHNHITRLITVGHLVLGCRCVSDFPSHQKNIRWGIFGGLQIKVSRQSPFREDVRKVVAVPVKELARPGRVEGQFALENGHELSREIFGKVGQVGGVDLADGDDVATNAAGLGQPLDSVDNV